mgnify:CR=1 FL=1
MPSTCVATTSAGARRDAVRPYCRAYQELYRCALGVLRCYLRRVRRRRRDYLAVRWHARADCATVSNTLGNVGGIVCDGAKASCAAKISAAVDAAILGHDMAMQGRGFRAGEGLIQDTVEQTIASMGYVGRVGMKDTDVEILNIMIGKTRVC